MWIHDLRCKQHVGALAGHEAGSYSLAYYAARYNYPKMMTAIISRGFLQFGVYSWEKRIPMRYRKSVSFYVPSFWVLFFRCPSALITQLPRTSGASPNIAAHSRRTRKRGSLGDLI